MPSSNATIARFTSRSRLSCRQEAGASALGCIRDTARCSLLGGRSFQASYHGLDEILQSSVRRPTTSPRHSPTLAYRQHLVTMSSTLPESSNHSSAAEYVAQDRFNRRFVLPATESHGELQVSYADVGRPPNQDGSGTQPPTVLFIPGMFGTRYLSVWMHAIAEKLGVRVLIVDRYHSPPRQDSPVKCSRSANQ